MNGKLDIRVGAYRIVCESLEPGEGQNKTGCHGAGCLMTDSGQHDFMEGTMHSQLASLNRSTLLIPVFRIEILSVFQVFCGFRRHCRFTKYEAQFSTSFESHKSA